MKDIDGTSGVRRYLRSLLAWEVAVILPLAIVFIKAGRRLRAEDLRLMAIVVVFGTLVVAVCSWVSSKLAGAASVLLGFVAGVIFAVLGGILWVSLVTGFEARPAILIGCLLLSVPSGVGGAITGWFNRRSSGAPNLRRNV